MSEHQVWIIDDDSSIRWVLEKALSSAGLKVSSFETADAALEQINISLIKSTRIFPPSL